MNASKLKGKTIKKVHQFYWNEGHVPGWVIAAIEFTDGTFLRFVVGEGESEYGVEGIYPARGMDNV